MFIPINKLLFSVIFNLTLFLFLIIGIQNSSNKTKLNFMGYQSVNLPISFIIGASFITGSVFGNLIPINLGKKKNF